MILENTEWYKKINENKKIMIFGAKEDAQFLYLLIQKMHVDIECYIVSRREDNPFWINEKEVKTFDEIDEELRHNSLVVVSQKYENDSKMKIFLKKAGFLNVISGPAQTMEATTDDLKQYCKSVLGKFITIEELSKDYSMNVSNEEENNICIYAVTSHADLHKYKNRYDSEYIKYIQAGASLTKQRICDITDNTGDNISKLNPYYCELSAGYWICKNDHINKYVGLYHYSRGLAATDEQLRYMMEAGIDILLPVPIVARHEMVTRYVDCIDIIMKAMKNVSPDYLCSGRKFFTEKLFFIGNIVIARQHIFAQYYDWMFKVIYACENIAIEMGIEVTPRLWGYYGEVLTNIYFIHHVDDYKIIYSSLKSMY